MPFKCRISKSAFKAVLYADKQTGAVNNAEVLPNYSRLLQAQVDHEHPACARQGGQWGHNRRHTDHVLCEGATSWLRN